MRSARLVSFKTATEGHGGKIRAYGGGTAKTGLMSQGVARALALRRRGISSMDKIYNDFTINVATANGTGSQSANLIILHSLFEMGVPVSGKNLFPSNISG